MDKPTLEYLVRDHDPQDTWIPYPRQAEPVTAHTNCVMNSNFDLQVISCDITKTFFSGEKSSDWVEMVDSFYNRLQQWLEHLPDCINQENTSVPGVIDLQCVGVALFVHKMLTLL